MAQRGKGLPRGRTGYARRDCKRIVQGDLFHTTASEHRGCDGCHRARKLPPFACRALPQWILINCRASKAPYAVPGCRIGDLVPPQRRTLPCAAVSQTYRLRKVCERPAQLHCNVLSLGWKRERPSLPKHFELLTRFLFRAAGAPTG
jgi:hypothetical protein